MAVPPETFVSIFLALLALATHAICIGREGFKEIKPRALSLSPSLHALSNPGAGDLVVVWGPGGQQNAANRPEKGGLGEDRGRSMGNHHPLTSLLNGVLPVLHPLCVRTGSQSRE